MNKTCNKNTHVRRYIEIEELMDDLKTIQFKQIILNH